MGLSPSPAPLDTWGGFRVEEQPSSSPDAARTPVLCLRVLSLLPTFIPGQARQLPVSSQPPQPATRLQPGSAFPSTALLAAGHWCGQGLPRRLRRSVDGAAVGGRDPPTGGAGREVSVPIPPGWSRATRGWWHQVQPCPLHPGRASISTSRRPPQTTPTKTSANTASTPPRATPTSTCKPSNPARYLAQVLLQGSRPVQPPCCSG